MRQAGFPPAAWVDEMLAAGCPSFYTYKDGNKVGVYNPARKGYLPVERQAGLILLPELKAAGKMIKKNPGATLYDLGDGVACLEFHTKMNTLDVDIFNMIQEGLERAVTDFEGLVIGNEAENFSAGANLFLVVMNAQSGSGTSWKRL